MNDRIVGYADRLEVRDLLVAVARKTPIPDFDTPDALTVPARTLFLLAAMAQQRYVRYRYHKPGDPIPHTKTIVPKQLGDRALFGNPVAMPREGAFVKISDIVGDVELGPIGSAPLTAAYVPEEIAADQPAPDAVEVERTIARLQVQRDRLDELAERAAQLGEVTRQLRAVADAAMAEAVDDTIAGILGEDSGPGSG